MGALHEGHRALIKAARREADDLGGGLAKPPVIVSIFVNPRQFGPNEDFERYPRTEDEDLAICRSSGVDAVFFPSVEEMYPAGFSTVVSLPGLARSLCGRSRPGHFDGVATVVARLFGLLRPSRAYFGWKDAQQLILVRRMARDLALAPEIRAVETVREPDGLALSSRNRYLSPEERARASWLNRALRRGEEAAREGATAEEILRRVRSGLLAGELVEDYVELRRLADLAEIDPMRPLTRSPDHAYLLAAAVRCGSTRLIDNVRIFHDSSAATATP